VAGPAAVHVSLLVNVFRVQPMISVLPVINDTRLPLGARLGRWVSAPRRPARLPAPGSGRFLGP
jgi:hypothetical protein